MLFIETRHHCHKTSDRVQAIKVSKRFGVAGGYKYKD